jgi:hypothetical protein
MDVASTQPVTMGDTGRHETRVQAPGIVARAFVARDACVELERNRILRGGGRPAAPRTARPR